MAEEEYMSRALATATMKALDRKWRAAKRAAIKRGDPPPPRSNIYAPGDPRLSDAEKYKVAQDALKYHDGKSAAFQKRHALPPAATTTTPSPTTTTTPLPARTRTPPPTITTPSPTDAEFQGVLKRLGVKPVEQKAKGGVVKSSRKKSKARKKSKIDGIARKGHTRAKHR